MRRWIAGGICLALLLTGAAAPAEEEAVTEISWDSYESLEEEAGNDAIFVLLEETGIMLWMPEFMMYEPEEAEPGKETGETAGEEENEEEPFTTFCAADGSAAIEVALSELEDGFTLDEMGEVFAEDGDLPFMRVRVNGLDGFYLHNDEDSAAHLMLMYEPGKIIRFTFTPINDPDYREIFQAVLASIQKAPEEVPEE